MSTITALRVQPGRRRQVGVYVDGSLRLTVSGSTAAGLHVGQSVEDAELADIAEREAVETALRGAGRLLSRRPRSEAEMRASLGRAGNPAEAIERALERLKEAGQIDDDRFVGAWIENRAAFRPRSVLALRAELQRKGVARIVIDRGLAGFSEEDAALEAARRAVRRWRGQATPVWRRRLYAYLQRRGFGHETITAVVRRLAAEASASMESEGMS